MNLLTQKTIVNASPSLALRANFFLLPCQSNGNLVLKNHRISSVTEFNKYVKYSKVLLYEFRREDIFTVSLLLALLLLERLILMHFKCINN